MFWTFKDPVVTMKEIMFWLFKDAIVTVAWLNFDHDQSKIKLPQINFFLERQLTQFSCLSWPLSLCKIVKQSLQQIHSCEDTPFSALNDPFGPNNNFFRKAIKIISMYLSASFIMQNFLKILRADPELWRCAIFEPKMVHLPWTKLFW